MIKCIVFDLDDTLYDEIDYYKSGFTVISHEAAKEFGLKDKAVFDVLWEVFNSGNHKTTFNETAEKLGVVLDKNYIEKLINIFRNHNPAIVLPCETRTVLEDLKSRYKLGLITDGYLPAQEYKVKALDVKKYFDCIIYTESLGRAFWKPSPVSFQKLLARLNVFSEQCVYVADKLRKDFLAPNKLGFKTIRILRKNRLHKSQAPSKEALPQYEINIITELPDLLKKIDVL